MTEKKLIEVFNQLNITDQSSILSFAEFLLSQSDFVVEPEVLEKPTDIDRPVEENVIAAIKRLTATYPMIKKSGILDQAAKVMTDHMMHGKKAKLAINELELLFSEHYELYKKAFDTHDTFGQV
jgi:hypothetical protein